MAGRGWVATAVGLGISSGLTMAYAAWLLISTRVSPPPMFPFQDKLFHFIAFCALTGPAVLALQRRYLPFWLAHMLALAAGIELVQALDGQGREASLWDFLAGAAGIATAALLGRLIRARFERASSPTGE